LSVVILFSLPDFPETPVKSLIEQRRLCKYPSVLSLLIQSAMPTDRPIVPVVALSSFESPFVPGKEKDVRVIITTPLKMV
jgi:hypothetical protein